MTRRQRTAKSRQGFASWERTTLLLLSYVGVFLISHWLSFQLRFDFDVPPGSRPSLANGWLQSLPFKLLGLALFRQFSGLIGYFALPDLWRVVCATGSSSVVLVVGSQLALWPLPLPRGFLLIDFLLSTVGLIAVRIMFRVMRERLRAADAVPSARARRVAIIGAGDVGATLAKELLSRRGLGLTPVAFFDDDPQTWRSRVHGIPVVGRPELIHEPSLKLDLDEAIIAMPNAPAKRIGEVVNLLQEARLKFETVPSLDQLATGQVRVSQLRPVEIADLLPRDPIQLEMDNIRLLLAGRVVLVTGAGGSIGSELCRQIVAYNPRSLLMVDQSEGLLYHIEQELLERGHGGTIIPLVASIQDEARMRYVYERFKPEMLFHAAAHKHVPMMESQPSEALKNNAFGTARLAELSLEYGLDRFVMISTDKAINPTNVMGASKRLAEIYVQALHAANPGRTKFMAVRFGNVLGSSGSVVPMFTKQIARGGPVTVTHPEVTRYFMTIPEAVGLVLQSAVVGAGGEIFVLDMGRPVKIVELARQLIMLSGLRPDEDIEIRFTGLRPGEKLFEELSYSAENHEPTAHPKIMRFVCQPQPLPLLKEAFARLSGQIHGTERNQLKMRIQELVPEYKPYLV
jgi:FlaA1/EpsC-like NDP-sugar epimerase